MSEHIPGTSSEQIRGEFKESIRERIDYYEALAADVTEERQEGPLTFLDLLQQGAERRIFIRTVAQQLGLSRDTLIKIYELAGIPRLSQADAIKAVLEERWQDDGFRERHTAALKAMHSDPALRAGREAWWSNDENRKKRSTQLRKQRENSAFNQANATATRAARINPENQGRYFLPTIQGVRRDIGYHAFSAWEANIARVLRYRGKQFLTHQHLQLSDGNMYGIDFVTFKYTPSGPVIDTLYEIIAHPKEDLRQLKRVQQEYPSLRIRPITPKTYSRLTKRYQKVVDEDSRFCGWEKPGDNLRTNPTKYT